MSNYSSSPAGHLPEHLSERQHLQKLPKYLIFSSRDFANPTLAISESQAINNIYTPNELKNFFQSLTNYFPFNKPTLAIQFSSDLKCLSIIHANAVSPEERGVDRRWLAKIKLTALTICSTVQIWWPQRCSSGGVSPWTLCNPWLTYARSRIGRG